jgi:hypothetical protein
MSSSPKPTKSNVLSTRLVGGVWVCLIASAGFLAAMVLSEPGDVVRALIGGFTGAAALDAWRRVMRKSL